MQVSPASATRAKNLRLPPDVLVIQSSASQVHVLQRRRWSAAALPSARFCFEGFLPVKGKERRRRLEQIAAETRTCILYEAPHRLNALLQDLKVSCGPQRPPAGSP